MFSTFSNILELAQGEPGILLKKQKMEASRNLILFINKLAENCFALFLLKIVLQKMRIVLLVIFQTC